MNRHQHCCEGPHSQQKLDVLASLERTIVAAFENDMLGTDRRLRRTSSNRRRDDFDDNDENRRRRQRDVDDGKDNNVVDHVASGVVGSSSSLANAKLDMQLRRQEKLYDFVGDILRIREGRATSKSTTDNTKSLFESIVPLVTTYITGLASLLCPRLPPAVAELASSSSSSSSSSSYEQKQVLATPRTTPAVSPSAASSSSSSTVADVYGSVLSSVCCSSNHPVASSSPSSSSFASHSTMETVN
jgi:hypothetical protein